MLIGMGIGFTAVAQGSGRESADAPIDVPETDMLTTTLEELIRLETVDADGNRAINDWEYVDAPTDAWHERLRLYRLA
jgi:hypothetical protein